MNDDELYEGYSESDEPLQDELYSQPDDPAQGKLHEICSTLEEIRDELPRVKTDIWGLFWFLVVILLLSSWSGSALDKWTDKVWHSIVDDADYEHITVLKRPVDCDFMHAPIGGKGCEYEKKTEVFGEKQRNQILQQATTDDERRVIQNRPYTVTVYWEKKEN